MAFGWIKALKLAHSLYSTGSKVAPLLRRPARGVTAGDPALTELTSAIQQLAAEAEANRRMLRVVRAASITAVAVSIVTLILVITHIVHA